MRILPVNNYNYQAQSQNNKQQKINFGATQAVLQKLPQPSFFQTCRRVLGKMCREVLQELRLSRANEKLMMQRNPQSVSLAYNARLKRGADGAQLNIHPAIESLEQPEGQLPLGSVIREIAIQAAGSPEKQLAYHQSEVEAIALALEGKQTRIDRLTNTKEFVALTKPIKDEAAAKARLTYHQLEAQKIQAQIAAEKAAASAQ